MDAKIKARWIKALRSGKYKQGQGRLRQPTPDGDEYCCLGVLCELAVKAKVIPPPVFSPLGDGSQRYRYGVNGDVKGGLLPVVVSNWAGVSGSGAYGKKGPYYFDGYLTTDNDSGKDFNTIADIIEREF